jgi:hypothetical protein
MPGMDFGKLTNWNMPTIETRDARCCDTSRTLARKFAALFLEPCTEVGLNALRMPALLLYEEGAPRHTTPDR